MQGTLTIFVVTFLAVVLVFGGLVFFSLQTIDSLDVPESVRLGKKVWQDKSCIECHTILGNGGYYGPDLTNALSERGQDWLREFFREPPVLGTAKKTKHVGLAEDEMELMLEYLGFVGSITRTDNWPPKPLFSAPESR